MHSSVSCLNGYICTSCVITSCIIICCSDSLYLVDGHKYYKYDFQKAKRLEFLIVPLQRSALFRQNFPKFCLNVFLNFLSEVNNNSSKLRYIKPLKPTSISEKTIKSNFFCDVVLPLFTVGNNFELQLIIKSGLKSLIRTLFFKIIQYQISCITRQLRTCQKQNSSQNGS